MSTPQGTSDRRSEILAARARELAEGEARAAPDAETVFAFRVGGERYALRLGDVAQVVEAKGLCPLAGAPRWLLGAIVARGRIVPVLDLRTLLGVEGGGMSDLGHVVVAEHGGELFGLAAEDVEGQLAVPRAGLGAAAAGPFVWTAPDRLALVDLERLAAPGERAGS